MHGAIDEHVVGGDAGLAGVEPLAPGHAPGGHPQVGGAVDDDGALASELERDGREVGHRGGHDHATDRAVARVEDVVEVLGEQIGGLGHASLDDGDGRRVEVLRHEAGEHGGGCRRYLGGLHDHGIAGGDGPGHGHEQQLDRVVPGGDDEHDAERLGDEAGPGRHGDDWGADPLGAVPPGEVLDHGLDLADDEGDVGDVPLDGRLAEVDAQRIGELGLVLGEHADHLLELMATPGQRAGAARVVGGAERVGDLGHGCIQPEPL